LILECDYLKIILYTLCFHEDNPAIVGFLPILRKRFWT
jgi:hypothetical protein